MKDFYNNILQIDLPPVLEIIIGIVLAAVILITVRVSYKAIRESIISFRNLTDQREKNAVYRLAPERYRYFAGLNTTYLDMPKDGTLSALYKKYKYQVAVAACDNLSKVALFSDYKIDPDGTRHRSDFFFLLCTGIKVEKYPTIYMHALFEDPYGTVISQPLFDVSYEEAENMVGHFCVTEMKYYPDKESAKVWAIHVTNLTPNGYVDENGKPLSWIKQRKHPMWEIIANYNNTSPGDFLKKISDEDLSERLKELERLETA